MKFELFKFSAARKSHLYSVGIPRKQKPFDDEFFCSRGRDRSTKCAESLSSYDMDDCAWSHSSVHIALHFVRGFSKGRRRFHVEF
jgi:hypothetical protein